MQAWLRHPHFPKILAGLVLLVLGIVVASVMTLSANASVAGRPSAEDLREQAARAGRWETAPYRAMLRMDRAMAALAYRHDGTRRPDLWGRPAAWAIRDLSLAPSLQFEEFTPEDAMRINALVPIEVAALEAPNPFLLNASGDERERALLCLTQAVYYESAVEPVEGQRAVAQVVLNRMRHSAFPNNVCGVVYQGSTRKTGCQFSFTCDGSVLRPPAPGLWARARQVADEALSGMVQGQVGTATFYHADYVLPYWAPTLVKLGQIGRHIFYRYPGPTGGRMAFSGRYSGNELNVSLAVHDPRNDVQTAGLDELPPGFEAFAVGDVGLVGNTAAALDSTAMAALGLEGVRPRNGVVAGRRAPTREEIAQINSALNALPGAQSPYEAGEAGSATPAPAAP